MRGSSATWQEGRSSEHATALRERFPGCSVRSTFLARPGVGLLAMVVMLAVQKSVAVIIVDVVAVPPPVVVTL